MNTLSLSREEQKDTVVKILAKRHKSMIFVGPPGTGKTHMAFEIAEALEAEWGMAPGSYGVMHVNCTPSTLGNELLLGVFPDEKGLWKHTAGPVLHGYGRQYSAHQATKGCLVVVDDLHNMGPDMESALYTACDTGLGATITLPNGETVVPGEHYRIICTTNGTLEDLTPGLQDRISNCIQVLAPSEHMLDLLKEEVRIMCAFDYEEGNAAPVATYRQWLSFSELWEDVGLRKAAVIALGGSGQRGYNLVEALASAGHPDAVQAIKENAALLAA